MQKNRLKQMRLASGKTQEEVAEAVHKNQTTISAYEMGTRKPKNATKKRLADLFEVPVDYLFYDEETKEEKPIKKDVVGLTNEEREAMIESLVTFNSKTRKYFESLSDQRVIEEYERMINL